MDNFNFRGFPIHFNDELRHGLVAVTENGVREALLDIGRGAPLKHVEQDATWLSNQRHQPRIAIECSERTARSWGLLAGSKSTNQPGATSACNTKELT